MTGDKRVEPLELFFDLVFVFALTQVTARLADDLSWAGLGRGLLVLALIWWAWAAYSWLTNEVDCSLQRVRLVIFAAMICMLIASLAIPGAFEGDALLFAVAYLGVRVLHVALFLTATDSADVRASARALTPTAVLAPRAPARRLRVRRGRPDRASGSSPCSSTTSAGRCAGSRAGACRPGTSPSATASSSSSRSGSRSSRSASAPRTCRSTPPRSSSAALGVIVSASLWWLYFDDSLPQVEHRLRRATGAARNLLARDCFAFLHLPLVAGIVLLALGVKKTLGDVDESLETVSAVALCGATALFLVADVAFRRAQPRRRRGAAAGRRGRAVRRSSSRSRAEVAAPVALACIAAVCVGLVIAEAGRSPHRPSR